MPDIVIFRLNLDRDFYYTTVGNILNNYDYLTYE